MVGCCFCLSKKKREDQYDSSSAISQHASEPGGERLRKRTQSKSTQSHGKKEFISQASGSKGQVYNAVTTVYTEPSDTTLRTSTIAADSFLNNNRSESPSQIFPSLNRNRFPLSITKGVETKELTPSEKLFLKYKTQVNRNNFVDEELLLDSDGSDSLSLGPIRNICTWRHYTKTVNHSHASKKAKHLPPKESNLLEFPRKQKYKDNGRQNNGSSRPLKNDEVPKGYGPPQGALLLSSRQRERPRKRDITITSGSRLKSGQPSVSARQGSKTTKHKVQPLVDTPRPASTPLEISANDKRMNDSAVRYFIPRESRMTERKTVPDQSDEVESQRQPSSLSQDTSSVSHGDWSGSESTAVSSGPTPVSPEVQSPSIISGSFTPSTFDLDATDEAGIRLRKPADIIFHHNSSGTHSL